MKNLDKRFLILIEEDLIRTMSEYRDYSIDHTINDDDFSSELLLNQVLYLFDRYKRASDALFDNDNLNILESQVTELIDDLSEQSSQKLSQFLNQFYSRNRLNKLLLKLESNTIASFKNPDKKDECVDLAMDVAELIDSTNLASNYSGSSYRSLEEIFICDFNSSKDIIMNNKMIINYYYDDILSLAKSYLIPKDELNHWWHQIQPIKQETLEFAISTHYSKETENAYISEIILQIENDSEIIFDEFKNGIQNAINWGRNRVGKLDEFFDDFIGSPKVAPSFSTWGDEKTPRQSDHAVSAKIMQQSLPLNKQVMKDLIRIAKSESDLSENERNNIIATAHLMLGERDEAMKLLKG